MMDRMFRHYGIVIEEAGNAKYALVTEYLTDDGFPLPRGERPIITYDRQTALARENAEFLTIDHPMVIGGLDLFLSSGHGTTSFMVWNEPETHDILLELIYVIECIAPTHLDSGRFLPPSPLRLVINNKGEDVSKMYTSKQLRSHCKNGSLSLFHALCKTNSAVISNMVEASRASAHEMALPVIDKAVKAMKALLDKEIARMQFLQERNGAAARDEIECFAKEKAELEKYLAASTVRLDAVRLIFRGPSEKIKKE